MSGVEIRVRADTRQARNELSKLEKSVGKIQSVTSGLARSITSAIAGYSGFVSIKGIVQAKDQLIDLENSIALVTGRGKESAAALKRLYSIAATGRVSVETTTATFNRFGLALSGTGKSTEEIFAVTEAVAKAATLSGASAESARAAIIQLGQGLASGELRGEELNSVLEQTPRIAKAIADGMKVPFGSLRELAKDGKITSEATFNAIISQIQAIDKEFLTLKPTVGSLTTVMKDEFVRALAAIDDIGGFSDSARSKIEFLTTAFRFVADRAEINFLKLKILLINLRQDFTQTAQLMYASIANLFSADFTVDGFKSSVSKAVQSLKEFLGISKDGGEENENSFQKLFKAPELDLSGYLPNLNTIVADLTAFATSVMAIFQSIIEDVITNSSWSSLFWKGEESIGGEKFKTSIGGVLKKLTDWATKIKTLFKDLAFGARGFNEFGEAGRGARSGGAVESVKNISNSVKEFVESIKVAIQQSESFLNITSGFTTRRQALSDFISEFTTSFSESGGILGYLNRTADKLKEVTGSLSGSAKNAVDGFILGPRGKNSFGEEGRGDRSGGALDSGKGAANSAFNFLSENKIALAGTAIASAIVFALPAELRSSLVQGALFGAGYVIAAGALFLLTQPLTLAIAGLYFLPNILDFVNSSGLATKLGKKLGDGIVGFFKSDGEGASTGQRIISAIIETSENFGKGLLEGLFGGENPLNEFLSNLINTSGDEGFNTGELTNKLAGALSLAVLGAGGYGIVKNGVVGTLKGIVNGLFGVVFTSRAERKLAKSLGKIPKGLSVTPLFTPVGLAIAGAIAAGFIGFGLANFLQNKLDEISKKNTDNINNRINKASQDDLTNTESEVTKEQIKLRKQAAIDLALPLAELNDAAFDLSELETAKLLEGIDLLALAIDDAKTKSNLFMSSLAKIGFDPVVNRLQTGLDKLVAEAVNREAFPSAMTPTTKAYGGYISGPGGPKDDVIPAMLSNGEFVIQAAAVQKFGRGFLAMINNGIMPQGFSGGGSPDPYFVTLQNDKSVFEGEIKDQRQTLGAAMKSGDNTHIQSANSAIESAQRGLKLVDAQLAVYDENGQKKKTDMKALMSKLGAGGGGNSDTKSNAETLAESFQTSFRDGFYNALRTGDFGEMARGLADNFSNSIIESFATGFTDSLFKGLGLSGEGGLLDQAFSGVEKLGSGIGKTLGEGVSSSVKEGYKDTDLGEGSLFDQLGGLLKGAFDTVGSLVSKSVGGLSKMFGSGGSFDIFGTIGSFFGFGGAGAHTGGLIQHRMAGGIVNPGLGQAGKDSVPVMLTPGEYVIPSQRTAELFKDRGSNSSGQQTFNINVSGDVSRQARQEIVKMIPQITNGVNAKNKENNFKR
jgi:tape measure domain-containing protein